MCITEKNDHMVLISLFGYLQRYRNNDLVLAVYKYERKPGSLCAYMKSDASMQKETCRIWVWKTVKQSFLLSTILFANYFKYNLNRDWNNDSELCLQQCLS